MQRARSALPAPVPRASLRKYILRSSHTDASAPASGPTPAPPTTRPPFSTTKYALRGAEYAALMASTSGSMIAKPGPLAPNSGMTSRMMAATAASSEGRMGRKVTSSMAPQLTAAARSGTRLRRPRGLGARGAGAVGHLEQGRVAEPAALHGGGGRRP